MQHPTLRRPARVPSFPAARNDRRALLATALAGLLLGMAVPERSGWPAWPWSQAAASLAPRAAEAAPTVAFGSCHAGGGSDCVVDGDTFWLHGERVRIADIDAPETHPPRCPEEARLGDAATDRLQALLNAGPVTLVPIDRDRDRYGRLLRVVERDGRSLGAELVREGLAREWTGRRRPWCAGA